MSMSSDMVEVSTASETLPLQANNSSAPSLSTRDELTVRDAMRMVSMMPMPVMGADIPVEFQAGLFSMMRQQAFTTAMLLSGERRTFASMLDMVVQQSTEALKDTKTELKAEIQASQDQIIQKTEETKKELQAEIQISKQEVKTQLNEFQKKLEHSDPVSQAWRMQTNIYLRQVIAWILYMGLDTTNTFGMTSLINFTFYPGRPETVENHLTVIPKALIRMLFIHADKFTPPVHNGIQTKIEAIIVPIFNCLTDLTPKVCKYQASMFPSKIYANGGIHVFRTLDLVRLLQEELKYKQKNSPVLLESKDFTLESIVHADGTLSITKGIKDKRIKKSISSKFRQMVGVGSKQLANFAKSVLKKNDPTECFDFLAVRRYWNLEASKEYLQQPAFHMGVQLVRSQVFGQDDTPPYDPDHPFHVGLHWTIDRNTPVEDFTTLIARYNNMDSADFLEEFTLAVETDDTEDDDDEESQGTTVEEETKEVPPPPPPQPKEIHPKTKVHKKTDFPKITLPKKSVPPVLPKDAADDAPKATEDPPKSRRGRKKRIASEALAPQASDSSSSSSSVQPPPEKKTKSITVDQPMVSPITTPIPEMPKLMLAPREDPPLAATVNAPTTRKRKSRLVSVIPE